MKSTNVRFQTLSFGLRALGRISPVAAARWMERMFLTVRRHRVPETERRWLDGSHEETVRSGEHRIAVRTFGESGPVVLLSHGWEGRGSQLGAFVRPLLRRGFRVITFDHPGHGESSGTSTSLPAMGRALVDVAKSAGPIHAVIAHSAGCAATSLALRDGLEAVRLVYVAPPTALEVFFHRLVALLRIPRPLAELAQARIERRIGVRWSDLRHAALAPLQREPLLVIHDRGDRETPVEGAREIHRLWPGSRLMLTDGLGHRRILRDPDVVESAVSFVAEEMKTAMRRVS